MDGYFISIAIVIAGLAISTAIKDAGYGIAKGLGFIGNNLGRIAERMNGSRRPSPGKGDGDA